MNLLPRKPLGNILLHGVQHDLFRRFPAPGLGKGVQLLPLDLQNRLDVLAAEYKGRVFVVDNQRISITQRQSVLDALAMAAAGMDGQAIHDALMRERLYPRPPPGAGKTAPG